MNTPLYSGKPKPDRCSASVATPGCLMHWHQCSRKSVKDGFCNVHHPDNVAKRQQLAAKNRTPSPWERLSVVMEKYNHIEAHLKKLSRAVLARDEHKALKLAAETDSIITSYKA